MKECCEYHDLLWGEDECGLAGMGNPQVCCKDCPEIEYFKRKGLKPDLVGGLED